MDRDLSRESDRAVERLGAALRAWRAQTLFRAIALAGVMPAIVALLVGWPVCLAWSLSYLAALLALWLFVGDNPTEALRRRPGYRALALAGLFAQGAVWGAMSLYLMSVQHPLSAGLAPALLISAAMGAIPFSRDSLSAFLALVGPNALYLCFGVSWMVAAQYGLSNGLVVAACGAFTSLMAFAIWRAFARSIRSEAQARDELEARRAEAAAAVEAKSAFVAAVSHDLRTPISAIQAGALGLQDGALSAQHRAQADLILDAGRMMKALLDDLLDAAKLEADRMAVEQRPYDLRATLATTLRFWRAEARRRQLRLTAHAAALPVWVEGDGMRLRQILNNLLSNALKFTPPGGRVRLEAQVHGDRLRLSLRDTGMGMSAEQMAALFRPFAQADVSVSRTHGGTGLGLMISRDLARLMDGELSVESRPGEGAVFTLDLPLRPCAPAPAAGAEPAKDPTDLPRLRMLAADDHEVNRRALALLLAPLDAELTFAVDGREAIEIAARAPFDILLLDEHMPGCDGSEVVRAVRRGGGPNRATPAILVTGAADQITARSAGVEAVVAKPVEPALLFAALEAVLDAPTEGSPRAAEA